MRYVYTDGDPLEHPQTYMYPPYGGADFLAAWRQDRLECLRDIEPLRAVSTDIPVQPTFDAAWPDTEACLRILSATAPTTFPERAEETIRGLIRRFEISKKLPQTLVPPGYSLNRAPILAAAPYARFAAILSRRQAVRPSARELNCLLKVNDTVISLFRSRRGVESMTPEDYDAMALGLLGELAEVDRLLRERPHAVV